MHPMRQIWLHLWCLLRRPRQWRWHRDGIRRALLLL